MKKILFSILLLAFAVTCVVGTKSVRRAKRLNEAIALLTEVYELEQAYRAMFGGYTDNIHAIIYIQETLVTEGGKANYLVLLNEATDSTFRASAVSVVDFDGDGQYSQWIVDETGVVTEIFED